MRYPVPKGSVGSNPTPRIHLPQLGPAGREMEEPLQEGQGPGLQVRCGPRRELAGSGGEGGVAKQMFEFGGRSGIRERLYWVLTMYVPCSPCELVAIYGGQWSVPEY